MSDEGWKKSLSIELKMKKEQGLDKIILVPGNHGEQFIREKLNLDMKYVVRTSNFIGYMLKEALGTQLLSNAVVPDLWLKASSHP